MKFRIPVQHPTEDLTHVEINASYVKAGLSYMNGERRRGGAYVNVTPIAVKDGMVSFVLFTGRSYLAEELNCLNMKKVEAWGCQAFEEVNTRRGKTWELVQALCQAKGIKLSAAC